VRLNLQKAKHLYFIYGLINTLVVVSVLIVVYLLYNKFSRLDKQNKLLNAEIINVYNYKDFSNELASKKIISEKQDAVLEESYKNEFIQKIAMSKQIILDMSNEHAITDARFSENIYGLILDFEELKKQNELLLKYLTNMGNEKNGLYYKMSMAAEDFSKKLTEYNGVRNLENRFNYLISTIKIFRLSRNEDLASIIQEQLSDINNTIENIKDDGGSYMVVRLKDSFKNFETSYREYAKKTHEIGLNPELGLISIINKSYKKIAYRLEQSVEIIDKEKRKTERYVFGSTALVILIVVAFNLFVSRFFLNSTRNFIDSVIEHITDLGKGTFSKFRKSNYPLETHRLLISLESFSNKLINAINVSNTLASGRTSFELKKEEQFEAFYSNIIKIKENIDDLNQKVREERKKQTNMLWIKSGIEKLTDVMRREYDNPLLHASEVVNMLVKFLNIPVGAIYNIKEENGKKYVEMMASFAYGKEKLLYQKIAIGEGVVGTAAAEKKTLNLTSVPEGYFNIISGFGEARPKNILVSPIKLNEEIYGVFELASLTRFKQEEIEFVEEVCRTVAYSFAISKVYLDTLYQFESLNMEVAQLEAENSSLTNDYEELSSSYQQLINKSTDNAFIVDKVSEIAMVIDLDLDGNILEANESFENFFKSSKLKVLHSNFREYITEINLTEGYDIELIWRDVRAGIQHETNQRIKFSDNEYMLNQHFLPMKDDMGRVKKIKMIAFDFTSKMGTEAEPMK
jgi:PAS domain-containing protein